MQAGSGLLVPKIYLFFDLETSGINPESDSILEVGFQFVDNNFENIDSVISFDDANLPQFSGSFTIFHENPEALISNENARKMHESSGLLKECANKNLSHELKFVEQKIVQTIEQLKREPSYVYDNSKLQIELAGNSIGFDRSFVKNYMPILYSKISHRVFDVRTLISFFTSCHWNEEKLPDLKQTMTHRAFEDVCESLRVSRALAGIVNYHRIEPDPHDYFGEI